MIGTEMANEDGKPGFYCIDNDTLRTHGAAMGLAGVAVYNVLVMRANADNECWPSYQSIAEMLGVSRPTVIKAIGTLIELRLISKEVRHVNNRQSSNVYRIRGKKSLPQQEIGVNEIDPPSKKSLPPPVKNLYPRGKKSLPEQYPIEQKPKEQDPGEKECCSDDAKRLPTPQQQYFQKICDIVGWDHRTLAKRDKGRIAQTMGILQRADYTLEDLSRFANDVWKIDWRWTENGSYPTLNQLQQEIGKVRSVQLVQGNQSKSSDAVDRVTAKYEAHQQEMTHG